MERQFYTTNLYNIKDVYTPDQDFEQVNEKLRKLKNDPLLKDNWHPGIYDIKIHTLCEVSLY